MDNSCIEKTMHRYNCRQISKIQDFMLSEMDEDNLQETLDFIKSNDMEKKKKYKDILYQGNDYRGLFVEGNQYLISSTEDTVFIIDKISEENGVRKEQTRIFIPIMDFVYLISNKEKVMKWIENNQSEM
ncbi:hypothetical protein [Oceanobacillus jeddahense]|uniref:Uncharacterized protein n=1 Tax=Oceanobacillus jeddahense TaxID=1462527 RepID=A0ABY5JUF6_9BACI|nr:hypothetical protein [Oceanobacillus jeddahense]UUI02798.1 hypothetical protein NP439_22635 [Oceanobacillus jeddahense]